GFAFRGGIDGRRALQVVFGSAEFKRGLVDSARESSEFYFAVGVGAGLEVEAADAGESVGDVDLDGGSVHGFGVDVGEAEIEGAGARAAVHDRDLLRSSLVE